MAKQIAIYAARSPQMAAYALVDDEDYACVAPYRWLMQGTPKAPRYVYRTLSPAERHLVGRRDRSLAQEIMRQPGRLTFRNGNCLDCRKTNLITRPARQRRLERGAQELRDATQAGPASDALTAVLHLPSGWTVWIDPAWAERLGRYRWTVSRRRTTVYVKRVGRRANGGWTSIYMARVIAGLQDLEEGQRLGGGVVTLKTSPDVDTRRLDLRATNLLLTTRGGINMRRPTRARYRGVHRQGQRYRAHLHLGGQDRVLGLYETPEEAAQARDAELCRLGLQDIARLNQASVDQAERTCCHEQETTGV
jgi:hypothetical protein